MVDDSFDKQKTLLEEYLTSVSDLFSKTRLRKEFLSTVIEKLKIWTDCQCVGIRVINPEGVMPYEAYMGFSQEFWEHENWLSVKEHQCVCIRVVAEISDPFDQPVLTEGGSIWTNDLQGFGRAIPEELYPRYRGKCIEVGFSTLAILAIRYNERIVGLIHLADMRMNMLPKEKILILESVAPLIGEVMARFSAEDAVNREKDFSERLIDAMADGFSVLDDSGIHIRVNDALSKMTGFSPEELVGIGPPHPYWPEEEFDTIQSSFEKMLKGETGPFKMRFKRKNGERFTVVVSPAKLMNPDSGRPYFFATIKDISGLVMARRELDEKVTQLSAALDKIKQLEGTLPICMYCKKIRDDVQCWHQLEQYISDHSEAQFSHGICPKCADMARETMGIGKYKK